MWGEFSSEAYKTLPSVGTVTIWNPFTGQYERIEMPDGGRGYYRPPSLVSVWATAPLLHNNSVGDFNNDPSVDGRVKAFKDAIAKLLGSGHNTGASGRARLRRGSNLNEATGSLDDQGLIWRLPNSAWLRIPANQLPLLAERLIGLPFAVLWILPLAVLALATLFLRASRWWRRWVGGPLVVLAFVTAVLLSVFAGYLVDVSVRLPRGLPVNVVANLDFDSLKVDLTGLALGDNWERVKRVGRVGKLLYEMQHLPPNGPASEMIAALGKELDPASRNRDHVMDRGHYFGWLLTDEERRELIALLLTF
jgi:hypothetical protein